MQAWGHLPTAYSEEVPALAHATVLLASMVASQEVGRRMRVLSQPDGVPLTTFCGADMQQAQMLQQQLFIQQQQQQQQQGMARASFSGGSSIGAPGGGMMNPLGVGEGSMASISAPASRKPSHAGSNSGASAVAAAAEANKPVELKVAQQQQREALRRANEADRAFNVSVDAEVVVVVCVVHTATPPGVDNRLPIGAWQLVRRRQLQRMQQQRRRLRTWRQEGCWTSLLASLCRRHHQLHVSTVCVSSWWWCCCCRSCKCSRVVVWVHSCGGGVLSSLGLQSGALDRCLRAHSRQELPASPARVYTHTPPWNVRCQLAVLQRSTTSVVCSL